MITKSDEKKLLFISMIYTLIVFLIFIGLYTGLKFLLNKNSLLLRGWVDNLYYFLVFTFIFLTIIAINYYFNKVMKKSTLQKILTIILIIGSISITPMLLAWMMFIYGFNSVSEHNVYDYNRQLIVQVSSCGFHHMKVEYYDPINFIIMKKSEIADEMYDGAYDRYKSID
ncbi:Uncharacterised protein [uncultured Clostridium sp.]|uniref:hypothetical protein n=1 Tax=uncultured Clostridium sp. TaxID=59620 RepID=UPI0008212F12|nr:hypothetical protein [uncultured Clostridium sp.]SCJ60476.1 Uncharacterised protein [uncultured Clostridium sp.]